MSAVVPTQRAITSAIVWEPELKQKVADKALIAYRKYGTLSAAAKVAKIDRRTLKQWINTDPLLKIAFNDADDEVTDTIEKNAFEQSAAGDGRVTVHLLASRNKRYAHKQIIESVVELNLDNVIEKMRMIAIAQPTIAPTIVAALRQAIERIEQK